jgi:apolipoprotein N-acyltransferase
MSGFVVSGFLSGWIAVRQADRATSFTVTRWAPLLAFLAGLLSAFAFQPVGLWPLMPIAFAGLLELLWRARTTRRAVWTGWLFAVGQFVVGLNWIATAFTYQAAMPAWLGWLAVVLLSFYLSAFLMIGVGIAWAIGRGTRVVLVLALAGGWVLFDYLRGTMFTGFAWNPVGVSLIDTPWLRTAPYVGTHGLSLMVVLLGGALWLAARQEWRAGLALAVPVAAIALLPRPPVASRFADRSSDRIRIVQPNIGQDVKWENGFDDVAARRLAQLSVSGARPDVPRLLLWPEVAITRPMQDGRGGNAPLFSRYERMRAASVLRPGDLLLTGGVGLASRDRQSVAGSTNSVFAIDPRGRSLGRYDKAHLVPYGEYLPLRPLLSAIGLSQLAPGEGDTMYGPGPRTIALPGWGKVGFQVCYEIIFSGQVIDRANRPDWMFNPSNDAWFGRWGPPQHLAQARLRAAEEGIPIVRSTPTGISAVIDAHGGLLHSLPWRTAGVIDTELPTPTVTPTWFARTGNWWPLLIAAAQLLCAVVMRGRDRYRKT